MEFVDGVPLLKVLMTSPANTQRQILTTIAEVLGRGILVHGLFHSDPHPGGESPLYTIDRCCLPSSLAHL